MNCVEFLQATWPVSGLYCIAIGVPATGHDGKPYMKFRHYGFDTIPEAAAFATRESTTKQVFHAVLALKGRVSEVFDGREVMRVKRVASNMRGGVVYISDIDCGKGKPYTTKTEGLAALDRFLEATGLPRPMIIDSGNGLHCYWILATEIDAATWAKYGALLKRLQVHFKFEVDTVVTADVTRILRPVGTFNRKNEDAPIKVKRIQAQETPYDTDWFHGLIEKAAEALPAPEVAHVQALPPQELPSPSVLARVCPSFVKMVQEAATASGRMWMITNTLAMHTKGGAKLAHLISSKHPTYNATETQAKLDRITEQKIGPATCGKVAEELGAGAPCLTCQHLAQPTSSPVVHARREPTNTLPTEIPPPQLPYARTRRGVEFFPPAPPDAPVAPPPRVICHYDLYPSMAVDEARTETRAIQWNAILPHEGLTEFRLPADIYHDEGKLLSALAHRGVTIDKRNAKQLGEYMSHYIRLLQQHQRDHRQHDSLGWVAGTNNTEFVLSDVVLTKGEPKPALLSPALTNVANTMGRKGTLEGQIKALEIYVNPCYVRQQFMLGLALGAPLLFLTQQFGLIANFYGPSGAAKTTALHAAGSLWGRGEKYCMGGTDDDATVNARAGRVRMYANLPVMVDEITLMPPEQIKRMAMSMTQATDEKVRQGRTGVERVIPESERSTLMICTSNSSAHALMAQNNQAGNAGSMRVLEILCERLAANTKAEADEFIRQLRENYGHIGPIFIQWCIRNMDEVRAELARINAELARRGADSQEERFWAAAVAIAVLALRIARQLGLFKFDPDLVLNWAVNEALPTSRRVVKNSYLEPIDVLGGYIDSIAQNMLVVSETTSGGKSQWLVDRHTRGGIKGRLEVGHDTLFLAPQPFKEYCEQHKLIYDIVVQTLIREGVLTREKLKLSRHLTEYASPYGWNLKVDLKHEAMAGRPPIEIDNKVVQLYPGKKPVAS